MVTMTDQEIVAILNSVLLTTAVGSEDINGEETFLFSARNGDYVLSYTSDGAYLLELFPTGGALHHPALFCAFFTHIEEHEGDIFLYMGDSVISIFSRS